MLVDSPKNPEWYQLPVVITSSIAALVALYKGIAWFWVKAKHFFNMPYTIETLTKESNQQLNGRLDELNDSLSLFDGRNKLMQSLLDLAFLEMNSQGLVDFVSPQASKILGRAKEDCKGNNWWNAIYPVKDDADRDSLRERWEIALKRGDSFEEEVKIVNEFTLASSLWKLKIIPIHSGSGKVLGWKALMKPSTEMK